MADPSLQAALDRLDRALARVERAGDGRQGVDHGHAALERRHDLLRGRVRDTIARLDALIGAAPSEGEG